MLNTSDTIRSTNTADGRVLLDVRDGQMFSVNAVGSKILELLENGWDEARIAQEISRTYTVSIDIARLDVHDFIETLRKHQIVRTNHLVDRR
ncbi:MAG: PqqD family protein [Candidatus Acidiferrales bacterium]